MGQVQVIGSIWQPGVGACAYNYSLSSYDIENMRGDDGKIARVDVDRWLSMHAGDFQSVDDFSIEIGNFRLGWRDPDSEWVYLDAMYGSEDF